MTEPRIFFINVCLVCGRVEGESPQAVPCPECGRDSDTELVEVIDMASYISLQKEFVAERTRAVECETTLIHERRRQGQL